MVFMSTSLAVLTGISSYVLYFKRGEKHLYPQRYLQVFILAFVTLVLGLIWTKSVPPRIAFQSSLKFALLYLAGLYASLLVFRLLLNPLNRFPGPFWACLSDSGYTFHTGKHKNAHTYLHQLHQTYGRIVRIGPNTLSITDADCVQVVLSAQSKCTKSAWYDMGYPSTSLRVTRDPKVHSQRRRVWSKAFSESALREYEARIQRYNDELLGQIAKNEGKPMDMTKWFNIYSFDVMGDLGFGESFGLLKSGDMHWAINLLQARLDAVGLNLPIWVIRLLRSIPRPHGTLKRFENFFIGKLRKRMAQQGKIDVSDISYYLIEHFDSCDAATQELLMPMLQGDTRLIIIAGSDTTAVTLTYLLYYIATVPGLQEKLLKEIEEHTEDYGSIFNAKLQKAPLLNACINETLRFHPAVAAGVPRKTPPEGFTFVIPGSLETLLCRCLGIQWVEAPIYQLLVTDPEYFPNPDDFIPERFSTRPDLIKHKDAWGPFNIGPYSCIGKNLAYMEIRIVMSKLLSEFEISLAPLEDGKALISEAKTHFTLGIRPFNVVFQRRE